MSDKRRFYEIYSKVNRLNEEVFNQHYTTEQMDDFQDSIADTIRDELRIDGNKMFFDGVKNALTFNLADTQVPFQISNDGLMLTDAEGEGIAYTVTYVADMGVIDPKLKGMSAMVTLPVYAQVDKEFQGDKIKLNMNIWTDVKEADIHFK